MVSLSAVKNATGQVVFQTETKIGSAVVTEVQPGGAKLRLTMPLSAAKLKEGDAVHTPAGH